MSMSPSQIKIVSFQTWITDFRNQPFDPIMASAVVETGIGSDIGAGVKSAISGLKAHVKGMDARDFLDPAINRARRRSNAQCESKLQVWVQTLLLILQSLM